MTEKNSETEATQLVQGLVEQAARQAYLQAWKDMETMATEFIDVRLPAAVKTVGFTKGDPRARAMVSGADGLRVHLRNVHADLSKQMQPKEDTPNA